MSKSDEPESKDNIVNRIISRRARETAVSDNDTTLHPDRTVVRSKVPASDQTKMRRSSDQSSANLRAPGSPASTGKRQKPTSRTPTDGASSQIKRTASEKAGNSANRDSSDRTKIPASQVPSDKTRIPAPREPADKTRISGRRSSTDKTRLPDRKKSSGSTRVKSPETNTAKAAVNGGVSRRSDSTQFRAPIPDKKSKSRKTNPEGHKTRVKSDYDHVNASVDSPAGAQTQILKGRFLLEQVIGVGGMGVVYKAKDRLKVEAKDRDPYVAIKVLSEEFKSHPEAFVALQRESRKAQRIAHPNTVKVYDFDRDGDVVFMTMEFMVGKPLDQMLKQYHLTGLPKEDAWSILSGVCSALIHAHGEKIVHSDLKPGNIYVTDDGMAKIFDFGIARAVANIDRHTGKELDRTVFDAGSLGALTPAYASLEMLLGKTPDTRDDVYALGCIAYEIFSGEHPFDRLPADEAYKKKLKPKRISEINKRQWKAIELALEFKRDDRAESVEVFYALLTAKSKPKYILAASLVIAATVSTLWYLDLIPQLTPANVNEDKIREESEFKARIEGYQRYIERLVSNPTFTPEWEANLWDEMQGVFQLFKSYNRKPDDWLLATKTGIYKLYLSNIRKSIKKEDFISAKALIDNAKRYTDNNELLMIESTNLAQAIKSKAERDRLLAEQNSRVIETPSKPGTKKPRITRARTTSKLFGVALNNVNRQLACSSKLNMRDLKIAVTKLRSLDIRQYKKLEGGIAGRLAQCITTIGKRYPEHALDSKRSALRIFKNNPAILAIVIKARDACDSSIAGLGSRGERAVCRDKLKSGGVGPTLVVVPGNSRFNSFAIGRYEVSLSELAVFCQKTKKCNIRASGRNGALPATNIGIGTATAYIKWLSNESRKRYRLPKKREWVYAANSGVARLDARKLDANRNCKLHTRNIVKGGKLVKTNTGVQNSWGLINYAGNAQEWVYGSGRKVLAVGGSYQTAMESCTPSTSVSHSGTSDGFTGFRVVRDLAGK